MGTVTVNGQTFTGKNISINNSKVVIDGVVINTTEEKIINIAITGDIESLHVDACQSIKVDGNVRDFQTMSGDVEIDGSVAGAVKSTSGDITVNGNAGQIQTVSGDVECDNVHGDVNTTSGDVKCVTVLGKIQTATGDIIHK